MLHFRDIEIYELAKNEKRTAETALPLVYHLSIKFFTVLPMHYHENCLYNHGTPHYHENSQAVSVFV